MSNNKMITLDGLAAFKDEADKEYSSYEPITYTALKTLRNSKTLVRGRHYRITDYVTTTAQENTSSAGHAFDIIVTADDVDTLNENATAALHEGDIWPFRKLTGVEWLPGITTADIEFKALMYSEDEITYGEDQHHASAAVITELTTIANRYGVLMPAMLNPDPHDNGNECYYVYCGTFSETDTINTLVSVQYGLYESEISYEGQGVYKPQDIFVEIRYEEIDGVQTPVMYKNDLSDPEYVAWGTDYGDQFVYVGDMEVDGVNYNKWNKFEDGVESGYSVLTQTIVVDGQFTITRAQFAAALRKIVTTYDKWQEYYPNNGEGFKDVYHLTNVVVTAGTAVEVSKLSSWQLKYCLDNDTSRFAWADTTNGKGVIYWMKDEFGNECPYDFKNILFIRKVTDGALDPDTGSDIYVYTFSFLKDDGTMLDASIAGNDGTLLNGEAQISGVYDNIIKGYYSYDDYPENPSSSKLWLNDIVFFSSYTYESGYYYGCYGNSFGNSCYRNTFGFCCYSNSFGNRCYDNSFGDYCYGNSFGDYCNSNSFGNYCFYNSFGNRCYCIYFGTADGAIDYCCYNIFDNGCSYTYLSSEDTTSSSSNCLQNVHVHLGVKGKSAVRMLSIVIPDRNLAYEYSIVRVGTVVKEV